MKSTNRRLPWPLRSVIAGTTGTAMMTLVYATERRLRPSHPGPLDYDDSLVPGGDRGRASCTCRTSLGARRTN